MYRWFWVSHQDSSVLHILFRLTSNKSGSDLFIASHITGTLLLKSRAFTWSSLTPKTPVKNKMMEAGVKQIGDVAEEVFKAVHGWHLETRRIVG